ncbi:unnamed protein product [Nippostrongylus brasiliensis]|uniref:Glycine rich superfamily member n=1 Tax=Nippostrongylus brasiliensis TaxID=27835 RepID=A0A0N4XY05_NIPBR|nr:unnamed protein product [Nippostrongylus brasiliensis]
MNTVLVATFLCSLLVLAQSSPAPRPLNVDVSSNPEMARRVKRWGFFPGFGGMGGFGYGNSYGLSSSYSLNSYNSGYYGGFGNGFWG